MQRNFLLAGGLALLTLLVYVRVTTYEFINLDDGYYVTNNPHVLGGLTANNVQWAFTTNRCSNWHPLTWLSLMLDAQLFGLSSVGFHATNLLLHIANTLLLFAVFTRMTDSPGRSAFVAAVFALHPLHVESVAWVSERKDVLSTFFGLLAVWAYIRHAEVSTGGRYLMIVVFYLLSLLSKQMLVSLPILLLLLDFWPLRRFKAINDGQPHRFQPMSASDLLWEKAPLIAPAAVFCWIAMRAQSGGGAMTPLSLFPLHVRIQNSMVSYVGYIVKTFFPAGLGLYYPHPGDSLTPLASAGAFALLGAITILAFLGYKSRPYFLVGWLWYVITLLPVIGLVQVGMQAMADRYTYIPMIGLSMMVAWGLPNLLPNVEGRESLLRVIGGVTLAILAVLGALQVGHWKNSGTIFEHTLAVCGRSGIGHTNLGQFYFTHQRMDDALDQFHKALEVNERFVMPHINLAAGLTLQGKFDEAVVHGKRARELAPNNAEVLEKLGSIYLAKGDYKEASDYYRKAIELDPELAEAYNGLGIAHLEMGELEDAVKNYRLAVYFSPGSGQKLINLAGALVQQKQYKEAVRLAERVVQMHPTMPEARIVYARALAGSGQAQVAVRQLEMASQLAGADPHLRQLIINSGAQMARDFGDASAKLGDVAGAIENYKQVVLATPNDPTAHNSLGLLYAQSGKLSEAAAEFTQASKLDPKSADAQNNLGHALAGQGKLAEALKAFREAIRLNPNWSDPKNRLAWFLATQSDAKLRNGKEAVQLAEQANESAKGTSPEYLDTLGVAYAEVGDFAKAKQATEKAIQLANKTGQASMAKVLATRLELYNAKKAYHDPAPAPAPVETKPPAEPTVKMPGPPVKPDAGKAAAPSKSQ